jgi:hypothetical protein
VSNPWAVTPVAEANRPRKVVVESWERGRQNQLNPEKLLSPLVFGQAELADYRESHPLASVMPVIQKLLVQDADNDSGMLVAIGDAMGRLLWVEGDQALKAKAASMMFVEGSDWSEASAGTSAPGTALALDHAIQIRRTEHFNLLVHDWSCTAVPVHDPETGAILGVIDITGGDQAVDRHTMPLMEATAVAVQNELLIQRMRSRRESSDPVTIALSSGRGSVIELPRRKPVPSLNVLGRDEGLLVVDGRSVPVGRRHTEILLLLSHHREGLSANDLAELVYGDVDHIGTLRAEMVRLRGFLEPIAPALIPLSKPYRLESPLETDALHVTALLQRGAHKAALSAYRGAILPGSEASGVRDIQVELEELMREVILTDASKEVLLEYVESEIGRNDVDALRLLLKILPQKSPKRAAVVTRLDLLERVGK